MIDPDGYWLPKKESPSNAILKFELNDYRHLPAYETFTTLLAEKVVLKQVEVMAKKLLAALPESRQEFNQRYSDYPALVRIEQVVRKQCVRILASINQS